MKSADFPAALAAPVLVKSPHFVLHHTAAWPVSSLKRTKRAVVKNLSTDGAPLLEQFVDNNLFLNRCWLGLVVPKRHAKRAVTRNLLKRQMRAAAVFYRQRLPPGQWLIRMRSPFDVRRFPSASSIALGRAARAELDEILARVAVSA